jgi:hypothetical protein
MQARQVLSWAVTSASVVLPLGVVLYSLQYQSVSWSLVALAGGAATAIALAELSARIGVADPARPADPDERSDRTVVALRRSRTTWPE